MDDTSEAVHVLENGNSKHMGEATADIETKRVPPVVRQKSILKNGSTPADSDRLKRAVSWQDFQGKELHEVREFEPRCDKGARALACGVSGQELATLQLLLPSSLSRLPALTPLLFC